MAAPVSIAHTHVHALRLAGGAEALAARVRIADGTPGYGFTLNLEPAVARDMATWDAFARARAVPLYGLLGGLYRKSVILTTDQSPALPADWAALRKDLHGAKREPLRIDPFAWGAVEMVPTIAAVASSYGLGIALLAPNAHVWEIQYCAALAASLRLEETKVIVHQNVAQESIQISDRPGIGIDWTAEPAFSRLEWQER